MQQSNAIIQASTGAAGGRQLPAELPRAAQRAGYQMLAALDRMGLTHRNQDGTLFTIRFCDVVLYGGRWVVCQVDAERLWHKKEDDLTSGGVVSTLEIATQRPVRLLSRDVNGERGVFYVVDLVPRPKVEVRLPRSVPLDLDSRPADPLAVPIGESKGGSIWRNLPGLGHTLIVGATGAGKSILVHCVLAALLTANTPDVLKVVLIDPKRSELTPWAAAPHVMGEIAHTVDQATQALGDVVDEIDERGDFMGAAGVRDIAGYNRRTDKKSLPYILVMIDETLDLVLQAGDKSDFSNYLKIIATRGRSAGVYLWAATQHAAAVSGLPRVVNVNLGTRIVFRVQDAAAAHVAGCPGAHSIPRDKPGRTLAKVNGELQELQGYYLDDDALAAIAGGLGSRPARQILSEQERALVVWARDENGGYLSLEEIEAHGLGQQEAKRLARRWEARKWLVKDRRNGNKRMITELLSQIAQP